MKQQPQASQTISKTFVTNFSLNYTLNVNSSARRNLNTLAHFPSVSRIPEKDNCVSKKYSSCIQTQVADQLVQGELRHSFSCRVISKTLNKTSCVQELNDFRMNGYFVYQQDKNENIVCNRCKAKQSNC